MMHPCRFWLLFLALTTVAILFAGSLSAASAAGKVPHPKKPRIQKPVASRPIASKGAPVVKIGPAYLAERRRK